MLQIIKEKLFFITSADFLLLLFVCFLLLLFYHFYNNSIQNYSYQDYGCFFMKARIPQMCMLLQTFWKLVIILTFQQWKRVSIILGTSPRFSTLIFLGLLLNEVLCVRSCHGIIVTHLELSIHPHPGYCHNTHLLYGHGSVLLGVTGPLLSL